MIIESVSEGERQTLLNIAVGTGLFTVDDAEALLGSVLTELARGNLPDGHAAVCWRPHVGAPAAGWAYFAPDAFAAQVWNLWWIGVLPEFRGSGAGAALLAHAERVAHAAGARILVIETSDQPVLARAQRFYITGGYAERGRIPDFYGDGEAKVVFSRRLAGSLRPAVPPGFGEPV